MQDWALRARVNFNKLSTNPYPGRGIVIGKLGDSLIQIYWIMGRSDDSRNRIFKKDGDRLYTEAVDPSKVKDPSLIIYNAMMSFDFLGTKMHVVSNGNQTDKIVNGYATGRRFRDVLLTCEHEPDVPNFTPRISAICCFEEGIRVSMSILKKSPWSKICNRQLFEINDIENGFGYGVTTYSWDGDPLPAFKGEPLIVPIAGENIKEIAYKYWDALNIQNRVSLAVKAINRAEDSQKIFIINKYGEKDC